jgi:hypothetical protein
VARELNDEQQVLIELRRRRMRMHPCARLGERMDDILSIALDRTAQRIGEFDASGPAAAIVAALIVFAASHVEPGELD